jgi:hypothetical protein
MWGAIQHVSTGLALVAFLGAAAVVAYRAKLKHRLRIINTVPRQRRAEVITKELNAFGVDAKNLTANQQYNLAKSELNLRARRFSLYTVIAVVAIGVFGAIAIFAILLTGAALPTSMLVRNAFSQTQRIKVMPPSLGGNEVLTLDNVATLRLFMPHSTSMITLILDIVPVKLPDQHTDKLSIEGMTFSTSPQGSQYVFDMVQNRREISVAGRTFIVTLLEINKLSVPNVAAPIEYVFGISEK